MYANDNNGVRDWKVSASCPRSRTRIVDLVLLSLFARTHPAVPPAIISIHSLQVKVPPTMMKSNSGACGGAVAFIPCSTHFVATLWSLTDGYDFPKNIEARKSRIDDRRENQSSRGIYRKVGFHAHELNDLSYMLGITLTSLSIMNFSLSLLQALVLLQFG